jgi:thiol:disulfide interchange protein DsbA
MDHAMKLCTWPESFRFCARLLLLLAWLPAGECADSWNAGSQYFLIQPAQPSAAPAGKIEVTEVFSFACPACAHYYPLMDQLRAQLPAAAQLDFLPAAFRPDEDWPVFQRAFFAAQLLGIEQRTHDAMFDAIWKTGELAVEDPRTQRIKTPMPSIDDVARFYAHAASIKPETFLATANSFGVDVKMRQADQLIRAEQVDQTPTIVVAGKYRLTVQSAGGDARMIELVKWLVAQESGHGAVH